MNTFKNWHTDASRAAVKQLADRSPVIAITNYDGSTTIGMKSAAGEMILFSLDSQTRERLLRALQVPAKGG